MANFVISTVISGYNSKRNAVINTFNRSPYSSLFYNNDRWKSDKISSRLSDLTVQKSGYNEVIPTIYGTNRLAGNIIWATDIKEVENKYTTTYRTGKGGAKVHQNNIEYYYYANVAIGICNGIVNELKKVWADSKLIDITKYTYRFYNGTENQEPDTLMQSVNGVSETPAYRGLCYIVFENLPLAEFGNRIPNFTFEVSRILADQDEVENSVEAVNIIPGCGEFVYDTEIISKEIGFVWNERWRSTGRISRINQNNNSNVADAVLGTKQLKNSLPNCKWVAPVVVWFGSSTNISNCSIAPKVEFSIDTQYNTNVIHPEDWKVDGKSRSQVGTVSKDSQGNIRYGGTVSDNSILRYVKYLKEQGFNVMFYPMIFMDIENKPWRGYLTGSSASVNDFFIKDDGYNHFILHYADLVKDYVDAFIIGSEFRNLTKIKDENGNFLAVDCFVELAGKVRNILGNNVKIGYASDWSEYHHTDGGWYNMDKLWASQNIDFIGIDAYFPLTDKKEDLISKEDIVNGWTSGEGYDWIYTDENRTQKQNIEEKYAWKNIKWWWENEHINPDGKKTAWIPKSKKIWFTEYGFASVDGTSNEPNKFYSTDSIDGGFPRFSDGKIDYFAQRRCIQATLEKWKNSDMVERKFLWCWDARPYPFFPSNLDYWSDGGNWYYGHWINGKLGKLTFSNMIKNIFKDAEIDIDLMGDIDIYDSVEGMVLNNKISVNEILNILQKIFFFDYYEKDGKLFIQSKKSESQLRIYEDDLVELENGMYFKTDIVGENELPKKLCLSYLNQDMDYQICNTYFERPSVDSLKNENESLPVVISPFKAKQIVEKMLYSMWLERFVYNFKLSSKYIYLNPSDVITLNVNNTDFILRIVNILINPDNTIEVKAVRCDNSLYNFKREEEKFNNVETILPTGKTIAEVFELPAIKNISTPEVYFTTNAAENGWKGCGIYSAKTGSSNFEVINENRVNSIVGTCLNKLENARPYYFDYKSELYVCFADNIDTTVLENIEMFDLLEGNNIALVGNEVIQFKNIELQADGNFKLSCLLRGQYGTENYINNHSDNEKFIFLNRGIVSKEYTANDVGISYDYKFITFNDNFENSVDKTYKITGKNLKPLKPVHVKISDVLNGYKISWQARLKGNYTLKDGEENINNKKFLVKIYNSNNLIRTASVENDREWIYTNEMITADNAENWTAEVEEC